MPLVHTIIELTIIRGGTHHLQQSWTIQLSRSFLQLLCKSESCLWPEGRIGDGFFIRKCLVRSSLTPGPMVQQPSNLRWSSTQTFTSRQIHDFKNISRFNDMVLSVGTTQLNHDMLYQCSTFSNGWATTCFLEKPYAHKVECIDLWRSQANRGSAFINLPTFHRSCLPKSWCFVVMQYFWRGSLLVWAAAL